MYIVETMVFIFILGTLPDAVPVDHECVIVADVSQAGVGSITGDIQSQTGIQIPTRVTEDEEGTISLAYLLPVPETYTVSVKFAGHPVPHGSFQQTVSKCHLFTTSYPVFLLPSFCYSGYRIVTVVD